MPISVVCTACDQRLKAPESAAGRRVECPRCGKRLVLPSADERALAILHQLEPADLLTWAPPPTPPPSVPSPVPRALPSDVGEHAPTHPPARRPRLTLALLQCVVIAVGVAGWAITSLAERDRRIAALAAEVAQLRADGDGKLAKAAEVAAARVQAERVMADQQRAIEQMREAAARQALRPAPAPVQKKPADIPGTGTLVRLRNDANDKVWVVDNRRSPDDFMEAAGKGDTEAAANMFRRGRVFFLPAGTLAQVVVPGETVCLVELLGGGEPFRRPCVGPHRVHRR